MRILLVSGSLRAGSTNVAVLRTVQSLAPAGVACELYAGLAQLPHFNPDEDREPLHPAVGELRAAVAAADAILFCAPEYAGALPGSFKNLLDWLVGGNAEIYRRPVAWLNVAGVAAPTGGADADASLRKILGYVGAEIVERACVRVPVARDALGADGLVENAGARREIAAAIRALAEHRQSRA